MPKTNPRYGAGVDIKNQKNNNQTGCFKKVVGWTMKRWWLFIVFGCLLLALTTRLFTGLLALILVILAFVALNYAFTGRASFLFQKIQDGMRKMASIFTRWFS